MGTALVEGSELLTWAEVGRAYLAPPPQPQSHAPRMSEPAPAFSSRRIPAPSDARVAAASTRMPVRERAPSAFLRSRRIGTCPRFSARAAADRA
jgi:hypothetical protein